MSRGVCSEFYAERDIRNTSPQPPTPLEKPRNDEDERGASSWSPTTFSLLKRHRSFRDLVFDGQLQLQARQWQKRKGGEVKITIVMYINL